MSESKHTKDPILSHNAIDGSELLYVERPGQEQKVVIAAVFTGPTPRLTERAKPECFPSWEEGKANAALFAAANELFDLCKDFSRWLHDARFVDLTAEDAAEQLKLMRRARAAIAKAEGRP